MRRSRICRLAEGLWGRSAYILTAMADRAHPDLADFVQGWRRIWFASRSSTRRGVRLSGAAPRAGL